jgi:hypothetical protein
MANGDDTALLDPRPTPGAPGLTPGAGMALANPPADQDAADRAQQRAERAQALQDLRAAQAEEMRLARARQKEMAPLYSDYATQLKQFGRTSEQQTQSLIAGRKDIPEYQPEDMRTAASAWMMAASLFGALAGGLGRRHISDGLAAYTGMLEGFNKGSIAATEQNYKTWQANADRALEYNRRMTDEYKAIMQNAKLNLDQRAALIEMTANKWQDQLMIPMAQQKNITGMANLMFHQETAAEKLALEQQKQKEKHDTDMTKAKIQMAQNGLKMDDDGNVTIDETPGSPMYQRALAISKYEQPPVTGTRAGASLLMGLVQKLNPTYDASKWTGKTAYARTAGGYAANVEMATNEVSYFIPQALTASGKVPRGKWVPINEIKNKWRQYHSDPNYADLMAANTSLLSAYARAINPRGVPRIAEKMAAKEELLNLATSQEVYKTVLRRMALEVRASHAAVAKTRGQPDAETSEVTSIMDMSDAQLDAYIANNGVNTEGSTALRKATPGGEGGEAPAPVMPDFSQFEVLPP